MPADGLAPGSVGRPRASAFCSPPQAARLPETRLGAAVNEALPIGPDRIWQELPGPAACRPIQGRQRPALFLDRDGVLNEEVGYLSEPDDLQPIPGSAAVVAEANRRGIPVVVVTNQGGIGRGKLSWADFARVQRRLLDHLTAAGASPDMVLACPFHEDGEPPYRHPDHPDRKPRPGMLFRAATRLGLDLGRSWIVGDSARDMKAGHAAGLAGGVLVATGHGPAERQALLDWAPQKFSFELRKSLADSRDLLLQRLGPKD